MKTDPAKKLTAVTLSDTTVYDGARGFHVNGSGTLVIEPAEPWDAATAPGGTVTLVVTGGAYYPYSARRFLATGSDASATLGIVAVK
jgi:hypothetical protein